MFYWFDWFDIIDCFIITKDPVSILACMLINYSKSYLICYLFSLYLLHHMCTYKYDHITYDLVVSNQLPF